MEFKRRRLVLASMVSALLAAPLEAAMRDQDIHWQIALRDAACDGNEREVRAVLARGLEWEWSYTVKYAKKALKCAKKKGFPAIADLIERAQAGEKIFSAEEEEAHATAAEGDKAAAEGDAKTALSRYAEALKAITRASTLDGPIREKAIRLARTMEPPPAVPEEARRLANRGALFTKKAQSQADYEDAISELSQASTLAPWWPDPYFNLGLVLEKAGRYDEATANLHIYLLAVPDAPDREAVETKLDEIAVEKRMAQRHQAEDDQEDEAPTKPSNPHKHTKPAVR